MASQKLFSDFPNVSGVPGMVTPEMTADVQVPTNWGAINAALNARKASSGPATLKAYPGRAKQSQQWRTYSPGEIKLRSAFNQMYAPQLQSVYHNKMAGREGVSPAYGGIPRKAHSNLPGGAFTSGIPYQQGKVTPYRMGGNELNAQLNAMWRNATDPYWQAAARMGGGTLKAMTPGGSVGGSNPYAWKRMVEGG